VYRARGPDLAVLEYADAVIPDVVGVSLNQTVIEIAVPAGAVKQERVLVARQPAVVEYEPSAVHSERLGRIERKLWEGLSVSPDGRWLLFSGFDNTRSGDLYMVENFR
jgi:hypothetical protein